MSQVLRFFGIGGRRCWEGTEVGARELDFYFYGGLVAGLSFLISPILLACSSLNVFWSPFSFWLISFAAVLKVLLQVHQLTELT